MNTVGESITYSTNDTSSPADLRFIHYNDVYHIGAASREPIGGIARFKTVCDSYHRQPGPEILTFFSGDAFSPSLESSITKGKHMLGALNSIGTNVACLGNHELDFGVEQFQHLATQCDFPWLCANVLDPALGVNVPLGGCRRTVMLRANGFDIGVIGLVEREWLETINALPPDLIYISASATATELAPQLRAAGAQMVVCVCHQREQNDFKLARLVPAGLIDIVLGGHDHFYAHAIVNGTHVLRSGTDFQNLSYIECRRTQQGGWDFHIVRRDITGSVDEDPVARRELDKITESLRPKLEKAIGYTAVPLDARFTTVRLKESNLGNFVCDLMQRFYEADCCIMCAGTMRGDQVYPPGVIQVKDMMSCFPFEDPCVVLGVMGRDILGALENGVSKWPSQEGRFPQVSGIRFSFDPSKSSGSRCVSVHIGGKSIVLDREYILVTRDYMARGKDGYVHLLPESAGGNARSIVSAESGLLISTILRQYFLSLKAVSQWKDLDASMGKQWSRIQDDLHQVHPVHAPRKRSVSRSTQPITEQRAQGTLPRQSEIQGDLVPVDITTTALTEREHELLLMRRVMRKWWHLAGIRHPNLREHGGDDPFDVRWTKKIAPRIEGRITTVETVNSGAEK